MEKIDRSCVITDLKQASCFWRNTLCFGTLTLVPVGERVICVLKSLLRYSFGGLFKKTEAVLFFQQFTQVFFWEAKNC